MKTMTLTGTPFRAGLLLVLSFMACMAWALPVCAELPMPHTIIPFQCWGGCHQDDPGNYRGMYWGQSLAELKDMKYVASDPVNAGESYYVRQGDALELNGVKLEYVQYGFWKGLYSSVAYGTQGPKNWYALQEVCFDNFGRWYQPNKTLQKYYWTGTHSAMVLEYNEAQEAGQLYIYSKTIYDRQLAATRQGYRR